MGQSTSGNTYRNIPSWNDAGRPKNPKEGVIGFNVKKQSLEIKSGLGWLKLPMKKL